MVEDLMVWVVQWLYDTLRFLAHLVWDDLDDTADEMAAWLEAAS